MAEKEKKANVAESDVSNDDVNVDAQEEVLEDEGLNLVVERIAARDYKTNKLAKSKTTGEQLYNYMLNAEMRGKPKKIQFVPTQDSGYAELMDLVFDDGKSRYAELKITYVTSVQDKIKTTRPVYELSNSYDGVEYKCRVKPYGQTNTDLLTNYINLLRVTALNNKQLV